MYLRLRKIKTGAKESNCNGWTDLLPPFRQTLFYCRKKYTPFVWKTEKIGQHRNRTYDSLVCSVADLISGSDGLLCTLSFSNETVLLKQYGNPNDSWRSCYNSSNVNIHWLAYMPLVQYIIHYYECCVHRANCTVQWPITQCTLGHY